MQEIKLRSGKYMIPAQMWEERDRIFIKFGFNRGLLDEVKAMEGAKWHGYEEVNPRKLWSIKKSNRNLFQLQYLMGQNPYKHYDAPLVEYKSKRPLYQHQIEMVQHCLTRRACILAAEMGCGKSLVAIEVLEQYPDKKWFWIGPKPALRAAHEQFEHWKATVKPEFYTYEGLVKVMENWPKGKKAPFGVVFDESSRLKNPTAQRSQAALALAEGVRQDHGDDGFIIEMSGSPAPKSPADWWHQCEVAKPGFLREGTFMKFKNRMGLIVTREGITGGSYPHLVTWRDDERKCASCGAAREAAQHDTQAAMFGETHHPFSPSINEVTKLYERMKGLVLVKFKKDCLDLPEKVYLTLRATPSRSVLNAAKILASKAPNAAQALTLLRELSDGFQYKEIEVGRVACSNCGSVGKIFEKYDPEYPDLALSQEAIEKGRLAEREAECPSCQGAGDLPKYQREAKQIPCPKEDLLRDILEKQEDIGRIVIYAGFTGSVDRCVSICASEKWSTIRVDGRGWNGSADLPVGDAELYDVFQKKLDKHPKVAFIGQPGAAGMGLTLTAASTIVYYSNDFNAESRAQSEDRIHRVSMNVERGATIIDLIHLPTDEKVIENLKKKRVLQEMSMGEFQRALAESEIYDNREV